MSNLIVVLMGGLSGERKISFLTGKACSKVLKKKVFEKTRTNLELELQIIGEKL